MEAARRIDRHPWLDELVSEPAEAVDDLLLGVAYLPGLQRAAPCDALMVLTGDLPAEAPEWAILDHHLCRWLQQRRTAGAALLDRPGGLHRFVRETGEAFRAAWRLSLPESSLWLRENLLDLLRWAEDLSDGDTFDLGRAVLTAGAQLQQDKGLRFLWFRVCEDAATPRLRHRLDTALLGLVRMPDGGNSPPSQDVITGLARWAARLPADERHKPEVVREWRALKAAFPRLPSFWRGRWEAILEDGRFDHPFVGWLKEGDEALKAPAKGKQTRTAPRLHPDIPGLTADMKRAYHKDGLTEPLRLRMRTLLDQNEHYADVTGDAYHVVRSCTHIASIVMPDAPGWALSLARRALQWSPSDGHAWSVRARALDRLGRPDLATAVLWEAIRRVPSNSAFYTELALKLADQQGHAQAEKLLRKAILIDNLDKPSHVELARLLWGSGRGGEALGLLREFTGRTTDPVSLYTFGTLLVAEGRFEEAAGVLESYRRRHNINDNWTVTLDRLIGAGAAGRDDARRHLLAPRVRDEGGAALPEDGEIAGPALACEMAEHRRLGRIGAVAEADLLFQVGGDSRDEALRRIDAVLAVDEADGYAHLVKALAVPEHRLALEGRAGRFQGSLPLQLAITPPGAPSERWQDLLRRFSDGRALIDLVRLERGEADDEAHALLEKWSASPSREEDGWEKFFKQQVRAHLLEPHTAAVPLPVLAHDALVQAVDVGWDALPKAA